MNSQTATASSTSGSRADTSQMNIKVLDNLFFAEVGPWSLSGDLKEEYPRLIDWIDNHRSMTENVCLFFDFKMFSSSSAKFLYHIIQKCRSFRDAGKPVNICWPQDESDDPDQSHTLDILDIETIISSMHETRH